MEQNDQQTSAGLVVLSFIFPFVGWILYFVKNDDNPSAARLYGICGIAGFIIGLILAI